MKEGDTVVVTYGFNTVTNKPFSFLYDYGYKTQFGNIVAYIHNERNMQDSYSLVESQVRLATEEDIKNLYWGT